MNTDSWHRYPATRVMLALIAIMMLIGTLAVAADCGRGDDKGPSNPTSPTGGGTIWWHGAP